MVGRMGFTFAHLFDPDCLSDLSSFPIAACSAAVACSSHHCWADSCLTLLMVIQTTQDNKELDGDGIIRHSGSHATLLHSALQLLEAGTRLY